MIYTMTLNPAIDRTLLIKGFRIGQVNRVVHAQDEAGGKGINVARALTGMGSACVALGVLGGDTGAWIAHRLKQTGIDHDFVFVEAPTRTNIKVIDPDSGQTTDINQPGASLPRPVIMETLAKAERLARSGDHMVFSGRLPPGAVTADVVDSMRRLIARGVIVWLDAEGALLREGLAVHPFLIKPNLHEFAGLAGRALTEAEAVAHAVAIAGEGTRVALSMGEAGAIYAGPEGVWRARALPVKPFGTVGAGDTMLAALVSGFDQRLSIPQILRMAMAAGAASVARQSGEDVDWSSIQAQSVNVSIEPLST